MAPEDDETPDDLKAAFLGAVERRNAWSDQALLDDLMFDITSDAHGLWELHGAGPRVSTDNPYIGLIRRVQRLVREIVQKGWADVWERQVTYLPGNEAEFGPRVRLDESRAAEALADDAHWDYEVSGDASIRYFVLATDQGDREWHEDGRRRGLFRSY